MYQETRQCIVLHAFKLYIKYHNTYIPLQVAFYTQSSFQDLSILIHVVPVNLF